MASASITRSVALLRPRPSVACAGNVECWGKVLPICWNFSAAFDDVPKRRLVIVSSSPVLADSDFFEKIKSYFLWHHSFSPYYHRHPPYLSNNGPLLQHLPGIIILLHEHGRIFYQKIICVRKISMAYEVRKRTALGETIFLTISFTIFRRVPGQEKVFVPCDYGYCSFWNWLRLRLMRGPLSQLVMEKHPILLVRIWNTKVRRFFPLSNKETSL